MTKIQKLITLNSGISRSDLVLKFFETTNEDILYASVKDSDKKLN
jgi:hypothetical protein